MCTGTVMVRIVIDDKLKMFYTCAQIYSTKLFCTSSNKLNEWVIKDSNLDMNTELPVELHRLE